MRRAALSLACLALWMGTTAADSSTVQVEGGAEVDSNVQRVETGPGLETQELSSPVGRLGAKLDHRGTVFGGGYAWHIGMFARMVSNNSSFSANNES